MRWAHRQGDGRHPEPNPPPQPCALDMNQQDDTVTAALEARMEGDAGLRLAFRGPLQAGTVGRLWPEATRRAARAGRGGLTLDLGGVTALDTAGAVLLLRLEHLAGGEARWEALASEGPL